jgi:membrane-associated phospholipid phosphatase
VTSWLLRVAVLCVVSVCARGEEGPKRILKDQAAIWKAPFKAKKEDAKWWLLFGGATGALLLADRHLTNGLPNTADQLNVSSKVSRAGSAYVLFPAAGAFALTGVLTRNEKARETGMLGIQAMIDAQILVAGLKLVSGRQRPHESDGRVDFGDFGHGSFPSGHSISAFAPATVFSKQYGEHKWVPFAAYGAASAIAASRFTARKHFASDIMAGSALGYFIGRYVVRQHSTSWWKPRIAPQVSPASRSYGIGLAFGGN